MEDIDPKDPREQRKFGLVLGAGVAALGGLRWLWHAWGAELRPGPPWGFLLVAAVLFLTGLLMPGALGPVLRIWMRFALFLNRVVTLIVLTIAYFGMITPLRPVLRILRGDPLRRKWDPDADSYWEEPEEQPTDIARYRQQF